MSRKTKNDGQVAELFIESARYILGEIKKFPKLAGEQVQVRQLAEPSKPQERCTRL